MENEKKVAKDIDTGIIVLGTCFLVFLMVFIIFLKY